MSWRPKKPPFLKHKREILEKIGSVCDFIYQIGESDNLRKPSQEVSLQELRSEDFKKQIAYLKRCLRIYRKRTGMGRGIAGVQVGIHKRMAVIYLSGLPAGREAEKEKFLVIINPVITKQATTFLKYPEICMSANPLIASVARPSWIEFSYLDEKGRKKQWTTKSETRKEKLANRIFQHEIDHLLGIICIDKVESNKLIFESDPSFYEKATFEEVIT